MSTVSFAIEKWVSIAAGFRKPAWLLERYALASYRENPDTRGSRHCARRDGGCRAGAQHVVPGGRVSDRPWDHRRERRPRARWRERQRPAERLGPARAGRPPVAAGHWVSRPRGARG